MSADRIDRNPQRQGTRAGSSSGEPVRACRGCQAHRGYHLAPRPALVRAIKRGDWSCPRSTIAFRTPQARRTATTLSASSADRSAAPFSGRSGQPRVDSSTTVSSLRVNAGLSCVDESDLVIGRRRGRRILFRTRTTRELMRMRRRMLRSSRSFDCSRGRRRARSSLEP